MPVDDNTMRHSPMDLPAYNCLRCNGLRLAERLNSKPKGPCWVVEGFHGQGFGACWGFAPSMRINSTVLLLRREHSQIVWSVCVSSKVWRSTMPSEDLVLDRKVRDWVVVPLTLCILLMMVLRQYVAKVRAARRIYPSPKSNCCASSPSGCCRC